MDTTITQVTPFELKILAAISKETFSDTFGAENSAENLSAYLEASYGETQLANELANPNSAFYFIQYNHKVAGYLKLNVGSAQSENMGVDSLEVERIYIRQQFKRLGLGTQLIKHAIQQALKNQKTTIWLGVWEHNLAALKFYQSFDFEETGAHVFQLGDDPQTDLIMQKQLLA